MTNREIDVLVAEKVMEWPLCDDPFSEREGPDGSPYKCSLYNQPHESPCAFSIDMSAAWTVVEKMLAEAPTGPGFSLIYWLDDDTPWTAAFGCNNYPDKGERIVEASAETAAKAICLAALKAKGVEV